MTTPNSVGPGARIGYSPASIVDNDLELPLRRAALGLQRLHLLAGPDPAVDHERHPLHRLLTLGFFGRTGVVQTDSLGFARLSFDNTAAPLPPLQVNAGELNFGSLPRPHRGRACRYSDDSQYVLLEVRGVRTPR